MPPLPGARHTEARCRQNLFWGTDDMSARHAVGHCNQTAHDIAHVRRTLL